MSVVTPYIQDISNGISGLGLAGLVLTGTATPADIAGQYVRQPWSNQTNVYPYAAPTYTGLTAPYNVVYNTGSRRWEIQDESGHVQFTLAGASVQGHYTAVAPATGTITGSCDPIRIGQRMDNSSPALVITPYGGESQKAVRGVIGRLDVQACVYHSTQSVAFGRADAIYNCLDETKGNTTGVPGWLLSSYHVHSVYPRPTALLDVLSTDPGALYAAVVNFHCINVRLGTS